MTEIPEIGVNTIGIEPTGGQRIFILNAPTINNPNIPVSVPIGFPVVNIPGCVEARRSYENENLVTNDPDGNLILCDAQYPSYNAMDYVPEELVPTEESKPQRFETPETPAQDPPPPKKIEDCPPIGAAEIGTKIEDGKKEIISYQLIGNKCITQYKKLTVKQQIINAIPTAPQVVSTTGITLIATSAALATPFLLKIVKPLVKQVINKIKKKFTGKETRPNLSERKTNSYREKKGLPPVKRKK